MLILSYLWILALIPLLTEDKDKDVQWHAKHGIVLMVAEIALWLVLMVLSFVPVLGTVIGCGLYPLLFLGVIGLRIFLMIQAINGQKVRIPVVSDFADQWR
jgi:uncharacterized membrane protein